MPSSGPATDRPVTGSQELAGLIGLTRETATHLLGQLQSDGLIKVQRRRITVTDWARLCEECSLDHRITTGPVP